MIKIESVKGDRFALAIAGSLKGMTKKAIRKGLYRSGLDIIGRKGAVNDGLVKQQMNAPKTGRTYKTYQGRGGKLKRARLYTASASGQSPAVVTGRLRSSLDFNILGASQLKISANTPYAKILEQGGNAGRGGSSKIAKRNYLKRPILQSRRNIIKNIKNEIK